MGLSVVTVASGGLPVVDVTAIAPRSGTPVTEAANGRGVPVTKVVGKPGLPVVFETIGVAPAFAGATFNGTPTSNITMSNGNLTVTYVSGTGSVGVASLSAFSSGKFYMEFKINSTVPSVSDAVGFKLPAGTFLEFVSGNGVKAFTCICMSGAIFANGVDSTKDVVLPFTTGDVICAAVDHDNHLVWFRRNNTNWNGDAAANPTTGTGGIVFPAGSYAPAVGYGNTGTKQITGNFGSSAFAQVPPSGFTPGWPA